MVRQLVPKAIDFSARRKKWILLLTLFGASSYGAYKLYHSPSLTRKRKRLARLLTALSSAAEIVSDTTETFGVISKDLNGFLRSDSDEIPNSLKQLSKLAQSSEFSRSVSNVSAALTVGVLRGCQAETGRAENGSGEGGGAALSDRVMDRVFSSAGTGFMSVVVGSFARNLVLGFYSDVGGGGQAEASSSNPSTSDSNMSRFLDAICRDKPMELVADCIQVFVSTAVAAYLDKTMDVNIYDELFAGLTNPKHEANVRDMLVSICNGAVETFVKSSHRVLTTNKKAEVVSSPRSPSSYYKEEQGECSGSNMDEFGGEREKKMQSGWMKSVSSTLAVPSNRRYVIDMTGRVTFETMRSLVDFLLWKISGGLRWSSNIVHDQVVGRGREVVRYFSAKSSVIVTICLALYLHVFGGVMSPLLVEYRR